ncbi:MAG: TRAM domain-containing protein [Nitrososphaerales archaeon]
MLLSEEKPFGDQGDNQSRDFVTTPVKVGDEIDVTISDISRKGDGLTRVQGYVIFVPNTKRGDEVKIKVTEVRPNFAVGEIVTGG